MVNSNPGKGDTVRACQRTIGSVRSLVVTTKPASNGLLSVSSLAEEFCEQETMSQRS